MPTLIHKTLTLPRVKITVESRYEDDPLAAIDQYLDIIVKGLTEHNIPYSKIEVEGG